MFGNLVFWLYHRNKLPGKAHRNTMLCVKWDVKPYTLAHLACSTVGCSNANHDKNVMRHYCADLLKNVLVLGSSMSE